MKIKSIYTRQLILYSVTLFISFIMLGLILSKVYSKIYISQREEQLVEQGEKIARVILEKYAESYFLGVYNAEEITERINVLEEYADESIFLMNSDGRIENATPKIKKSWIGQTLTDEAIKGVLNGKIVTVEGKVSGMFNEPVLTVGYPITINKVTFGGVFICASMPEMQKSIKEIYLAGMACMVAVLLIGAAVMYLLSTRMSKPIFDMIKSAKDIADGNFESRVEIKSEDEIGQLADSFNNMAESLGRHEKEQRDFIANISHDLRSPLTSIQGFISAILDGTISTERQDKYLKIALEETRRLAKLTNDIVELRAAQTSGITISEAPFDVNDIIRDCIERTELRLKDKGISVNAIFAGASTVVYADREKILRVLYNLVDNAIKFTPNNGRIDIETTIKNKNDKKVIVSVRDNGRGLSEEERKYVFDRFYKADRSRGKDKTGGGIGLSIAKEIMLAHGETIGVRSKEGEGSEFIFSLKLYDKKFG